MRITGFLLLVVCFPDGVSLEASILAVGARGLAPHYASIATMLTSAVQALTGYRRRALLHQR